jgi:Icc-related predicted phosphoesterase
MKITFISDTHNKHNQIQHALIGGDILIHCGDVSSMGYKYEVEKFLKWFSRQPYKYKVFIAGNHDFLFQNEPEIAQELLNKFSDIIYLQDSSVNIEGLRIYGTPWMPTFLSWAFNLPKDQLQEKIDKIKPCDILITHHPPFGRLDMVVGKWQHLGCELLIKRVEELKPLIHCFGDIHTGYGYQFDGYTHFINASVLNEQYLYQQPPISVELNGRNIKFYDKFR